MSGLFELEAGKNRSRDATDHLGKFSHSNSTVLENGGVVDLEARVLPGEVRRQHQLLRPAGGGQSPRMGERGDIEKQVAQSPLEQASLHLLPIYERLQLHSDICPLPHHPFLPLDHHFTG